MPIVTQRREAEFTDRVLRSGASRGARDLARNPRKMSLVLLVTAVAILGFVGLLVASAYAGEAATAMRIGALVWLVALGAVRGAIFWRRPMRRWRD
jgi:hypothetical protein